MDKTALALGGGGAKGAYEIGVWKALRELSVPIHIVTGTSVGALNGAMVAQGDFVLAQELWRKVKTEDILKIDPIKEEKPDLKSLKTFAKEFLQNKGGDSTPLYNLLNTYVDEKKIRESQVDFGLVTVSLPTLKPLCIFKDEMEEGMLTQYMMASSALFPAMKAQMIDGISYVDGAAYDNVPVNMAIKRGAQRVIAVDLKAPGIRRKYDETVPVISIVPKWDLGAPLTFDPKNSERIMDLGYLNTLQTFGKLEGGLFAFPKGELSKCLRQGEVFTKLYATLRPAEAITVDPLKLRLMRRMRKEAGSKDLKRMIMAGVELAAEVVGLSPLKVYTLCQMCQEIQQTCENTVPALEEDLEMLAQRNFQDAFNAIKDLMKKKDRKSIAAAFYWLIGRVQRGKSEKHDLWMAASVFPAEFMAGLIAAGFIV